jgi:hypothetical protein
VCEGRYPVSLHFIIVATDGGGGGGAVVVVVAVSCRASSLFSKSDDGFRSFRQLPPLV